MFSDEVQGCKDMLFFNFLQDSTEIGRRNSLKKKQEHSVSENRGSIILFCKFPLCEQSLVSQLLVYISQFSWDLRQYLTIPRLFIFFKLQTVFMVPTPHESDLH
jgi:hypothetical protein